MREDRNHSVFHHALKVLPDVCTGCTHCMTACPTQAIRVRDGLAQIMDERCVDCGECYKACPVSAIIIEQDDFQDIYQFKLRVALMPSVLIGQFPSSITTEEIFGAVKKLGFTHIVEIDSFVDLVKKGYDHFINAQNGKKPLISTFCPAVVRLIQVRFPGLVDHLIGVKPPSDIAAIQYREKLLTDGFTDEEIGMFYVTPCAAKIASIKTPVGEEKSPVNGVINMEYLYNKVLHLIMKKEAVLSGRSDSGPLNPKGVLWSLTRGESNNQKGRSLAIDGMHNVAEFLEKLEDTETSNIDFLELRACDESCAGGVLISGNRFLTVERLNSRAYSIGEVGVKQDEEGEFDIEKHGLRRIPARSILSLDNDRKTAIEKMNKVEDLLKVLPGIDCGACGAPSCRVLAEDIVQENGSLESCVFLQELYISKGRMTAGQADSINAGIWGENRNYRSQNI